MALLEKARWYRHRIAAMSAPEIAHRASESAKRRHDRYRSQRFVPTPVDHGALPQLPGLREGLAGWKVPPELPAQWDEELAKAKSGEFFLLGQAWPIQSAVSKWHLDPVTGKSWPQDRYCFAIEYRHAHGMGDVKYVWELNRLQYLQPIAALAFLRKDVALAVFCLSEIEDWIDHNKPHQGVNWSSGIELALRAVSILVVASLVGEHATPAQRTKIWATLEAHGLWLERYPSRFSSANNHRTAEGLGLYVIGALCPAFGRAARWKTHGLELLCETARLQILPDGVGAEQTPNYTAVVLEMLLLGLSLARAQGSQLPDYYEKRIMLGGEYLRWFMDDGGNTPRIGDDDNARVLGTYRRDETYVRSVLGCIAAMTNRADLTPPNDAPHLRQALFGFPPMATQAPLGVRLFDSGGYTVGRHRAGDKPLVMLAMDHGYLGYLGIAAHGHADALALWLHIGDQPVLADAGTYLYHSGGAWRTHFRGTAAHNTLLLEKADSSLMSGHFNWSHKADARLIGSDIAVQNWWVEAEHDGYEKRFGARHRRRLDVTPASGFRVTDQLIGGVSREVAIGYLLHPGLSAVEEAGEIHIRKGAHTLLLLRHEGPLTVRLEEGWYSPTFGVKEAAVRIVFAGSLAPEQKAVTHAAFG